jgi:L-asparaginase/Glu-tRNA(Gln) amidotransferase subunit D
VVFTLGGTIAMTAHDGGVVARLGGRDLLAGIDGLAEAGGTEVRDLRARGLIGAGQQHPYKARVLVAAGAGRKQVAAAFAGLG